MRSQSGADGRSAASGRHASPVRRSDGRRTDSRRRPRGGRLASTRGHRPGRPVSMWPPAGLELRPLGSARHARREVHSAPRALSFHALGISRAEGLVQGGLCERCDSAPLRGEFLRWVPDRLPLRFAALQASGKARLKVWAQLSPPLSRAHAAKAECDPGPSARLRRKAAPNSFRRGLQRRGEGDAEVRGYGRAG